MEETISSTKSNDQDLRSRISIMENENKKMRDEFNMQRAKMKELYLQKEGECKKLTKDLEELKSELDEAKSQIVVAEYKKETEMQTHERKAQEEIASLQHLIQETIEESSTSKGDLKKLYNDYEKLRTENQELKDQVSQQQQQDKRLTPVLNHVKKTLARKLGGDTTNDNLEESMRKAKEDAEVLRSLVVPLEEEIKALKEKIRAQDEDLQKIHGTENQPPESALIGMVTEKHTQQDVSIVAKQKNQLPQTTSTNNNVENSSQSVINLVEKKNLLPCEMCENYELKLVQAQNLLTEEKQKSVQNEKMIERLKEDLNKEGSLRRDLETQWQQKREAHKEEVQNLSEKFKKSELNFIALQKRYKEVKEEINNELLKLTNERESLHKHLEMLHRDNDILAGKYIAHSEHLQNQKIDLPNNVEELQEILLKSHENLIEAKVGCEFAELRCLSYKDEASLLRDQYNTLFKDNQTLEQELRSRINILEQQVKLKEIEQEKMLIIKETLERNEQDMQNQTSEIKTEINTLKLANEKLEKLNGDLKAKMSVLQTELMNSEAVQKDFVRLSQSLQMELEKIRAADTQVRWQEDDDVDMCINCKTMFTVTRRKQHCRHCGTIYCDKCLTKTVTTGPSNKLARVCDVCHTLLVRNTAPYFSRAPPQSP